MRLEENPLDQIDENSFRLLATYPVDEFNEYFQTQIPVEEYDTVGGLVFGLFGRIPRSGEAITYENLKFRVEKMKGARILNLHLTVISSVSNGNQEKAKEET
jgi:magnesium and cobalt transporter